MKEDKSLQPRTPFRRKVILAIFGLSLFFLLLEVGLRLGGFILLSMQDYRNRQSIRHKGSYRILCLGESTTQNQYPAFLEEALNQRNTEIRFSVIDKGRGGTNTPAILSQVESYLDEYHPDIVVAMMGINDKGGHVPYEKPTLSKTVLFIRSLRTYKLARLLWLHMVIKANPQSSRLNIKLKEAHLRQEDKFENEAALKKALAFNPKNDWVYFKLGWLYRNQGQFQQAEECFKKALEFNPGNERAYFGLGRLYQDQGQFQRAEEILKKALEPNPKDDRVYLELSWLYRNQGQFQQAEECFKKALEFNPGNERAYFGLGRLYQDQGQFQRAEEYFKKVLEFNPGNDEAYFELGRLYQDQGQFQRAEEYFKKALKLNPKENRVYLELGWLYRNQKQFQQAKECFKEALELDSNDVSKLYGALGTIYDEMGQSLLAEECYSNANQVRLSEYDPTTAYNYLKLKKILDKRKIKLVCVQSPMRNIEPLKKIFQGNAEGILFVDNEKVFKEAVKKGSYKMYFWNMFAGDFGHCTKKGNRLLAGNIAKVILKEVFHK